MGQQVSRSLTRTLPVLFWTKRLPLIGCQSPQPFSFHLTALLWPPAFPSSQMIWTNTVGCLFVAHWLYLSTSSCTVPFSTLCQTFVFKIEKNIYIYKSSWVLSSFLTLPVGTFDGFFVSVCNRLKQSAMSFSSQASLCLLSRQDTGLTVPVLIPLCWVITINLLWGHEVSWQRTGHSVSFCVCPVSVALFQMKSMVFQTSVFNERLWSWSLTPVSYSPQNLHVWSVEPDNLITTMTSSALLYTGLKKCL